MIRADMSEIIINCDSVNTSASSTPFCETWTLQYGTTTINTINQNDPIIATFLLICVWIMVVALITNMVAFFVKK